MDWHVRKREYSRTFKDGAGNVWGYMTAKELAKRYPNGGYRIVADLKKKENPSGDLSLTGEGKRTRLYAYNRKKKRTERTAGYIDVSGPDHPDSFVRVRAGNVLRGVILPAVLFLLLCAVFFLGWWLSVKKKCRVWMKRRFPIRWKGWKTQIPNPSPCPG